MNERELRDALRSAVDDDAGARQRSWRVVQAAYASYAPRQRRRRVPRAALAVAAALVPVAVVGGVAAAAPRSAVGHLVRSVLGVGEQHARPALVRLPGAGRLLVQAGESAWVVSANGTRRRLGAYSGASWSPHGLFVVAWRGHELTTLDPGGRVRWSLARPERVAFARWGPVDGFRIAYLAGGELRIVNGDGTGDHRYGAARRDVAPAWRPDNTHVLAYVDQADRVNVVAVDSRELLWRSPRLPGTIQLAWSPNGRRLLAATRHRLVLFDGSGRRLVTHAVSGAQIRQAAWAPRGPVIAVLRYSASIGQSEVVLADAGRALRGRVLFRGPGRFGALAWSPTGARLLIGWPQADQWLFLRPRGGGRLAAVANIARQFMPGTTSPVFPRSVQWCCSEPPRKGP
ncbi:MAG: hypothetical protein ACR2HN_05985 [Tepidiformaceae bacterium]